MQKNQLTLESVAESLKSWRDNKPTPYAKIPYNIKNSIKSIGKRYTYTQVAKALGTYAASFVKTVDTYNNKKNKMDFIELPVTTASNMRSSSNPKLPTSNISCTLQHSNGTTMIIQILPQQLANIIKDFICCN